MEKNLIIVNNTNPIQMSRIAYNFTQISEDETEIEIYDVISNKKSFDWWTGEDGTEVTPTDFKEQLDSVQTNNVTIRMNSGGGEVNAANVIAVAIQEAINKGKKVVCKIDGVCASAAVQIATACSEIIIHKSALMMIHNPSVGMYGFYDSIELTKCINFVNATKESIINAYIDRTGLSRQKLSNMMDAETYMDGKEAVEKGFADRLMFDEESEELDVINRVQMTCINSALNIPKSYQSTYNVTKPKEKKGANSMAVNTLQELKTQFPTLVDELRTEIKNELSDELRNEGIKIERARIKAIDAMSGKVQDELLDKAKYETFDTAEKVAMDAITNNALVNTGVIDAMKDETKITNNVAGVTTPPIDDGKPSKEDVTNKASQVARDYLKSIGKAE